MSEPAPASTPSADPTPPPARIRSLGVPIGVVASLILVLDGVIENVATGPFALLAMVGWLAVLTKDVLHVRRLGKTKLLIGPTDAMIFFALLTLLAARCYVLVEQFTVDVAFEVVHTAIRTYDAVFVAVACACAMSAAMPDRFARIALALSQRPALLLSGSFALLIAIGTLMLTLPPAVQDLRNVSFVDAFFTITSAVCVTGLTVNDVATTYTRFGHFVILLGIQFGGIGIMTIAALALTFGRARSLTTQLQYASMMDAKTLADLRTIVRSIVFGTLAVEAIGAGLLWLIFRDQSDPSQSSPLFLAIFHAVSAFCNAGFALFPGNLTPFVDHLPLQAVIMGLIICGGLGFPVLNELANHAAIWLQRKVLRRRQPQPRLSLTSRVVLVTSSLLLVGGTLALAVLEYGGPALAHLSPASRVLAAVFASVNTRTSGFNTIDLGLCTQASILVMCVLMFVGGSPGSTAGGIKTTTAAAIFATLRGELRGREPHLGARSIAPEIFRKAIAVAALSSAFVLVALLALLLLEDHPFPNLLFETVSAFGTVGLTTGITPKLSVMGKLVICATMFVGRVGPLTLALAISALQVKPRHRLASENLPIG